MITTVKTRRRRILQQIGKTRGAGESERSTYKQNK